MQTLLSMSAPAAQTPPEIDWRPLRVTPDGSLLVSCLLGGVAVEGMLDTGAAVTVVDTRHLPPESGSRGWIGLRADWGARDMAVAPALRIDLAGRTLTAPHPIAADLSDLEAITGRAVGLVIGQDILAQGVLVLDFAGARLAFLRDPPSMSPRWRRLELFGGPHGRLCLQARVDGGAATPAVFDLGSNSAVMMAARFAERHGLMCDRATSTAAVATLAGPQIGRTFTLASVSLSGFTLASPPAAAFADWDAPEVPLNLGFPIFSRFDLAIDIAGGALWLAPSALTAGEFPRDRSGLGVAFLGDRLRVMHVSRNSPAALGGWREAEEITAIDGRQIDHGYSTAGLASWRNGRAGAAVTLQGDFGLRRLVLADFY